MARRRRRELGGEAHQNQVYDNIAIAIEMFTDLRRWDDAKNFAQKSNGKSKHSVGELLRRQAEPDHL